MVISESSNDKNTKKLPVLQRIGSKKKVCHHWIAGNCKRHACPFLHSRSNSTAVSSSSPFIITAGAGGLKRKDNPTYINPNTVITTSTVCKFWINGHCKHGTKCRFLHSKLEVRDRNDKECGDEIKDEEVVNSESLSELVDTEIVLPLEKHDPIIETEVVLTKSNHENVAISESQPQKIDVASASASVSANAAPSASQLEEDEAVIMSPSATLSALPLEEVELITTSANEDEHGFEAQVDEMNEQPKKRIKLDWDDETNSIFCEVCVEEVHAGNVENAEFSELGWKNVVEKFHSRSEKLFDDKQLKIKWQDLMNDFAVWKNHVNFKHGFQDAHEELIDHTADQHLGNAKAVEECGLKISGELNDMCSNDDMIASSSNPIPFDVENVEEPILRDHDVENEGQGNIPNGVLHDDTISKRQENNDKLVSTTIDNEGKQNATIGGFESRNVLQSEFLHLIGLIMDGFHSRVTMETSQISSNFSRNGYSIMECVNLLNNTPNIEIGGELYMLVTHLFIKREFREMFVALPNANVRVAWLQQELQREKANGLSLGFYS